MVKTLPSNAGAAGLIPGQGAKIPRAWGPKNQNIKQKQYCNKFSKDFKNGPHQKIFRKEEDKENVSLGVLRRRPWNPEEGVTPTGRLGEAPGLGWTLS